MITEVKPPSWPSINNVAKKDRLTIRRNTIFATFLRGKRKHDANFWSHCTVVTHRTGKVLHFPDKLPGCQPSEYVLSIVSPVVGK